MTCIQFNILAIGVSSIKCTIGSTVAVTGKEYLHLIYPFTPPTLFPTFKLFRRKYDIPFPIFFNLTFLFKLLLPKPHKRSYLKIEGQVLYCICIATTFSDICFGSHNVLNCTCAKWCLVLYSEPWKFFTIFPLRSPSAHY